MHDPSLDKKIQRLRDFFTDKPEISMAFIFGSYAKGKNISESDIDVAVYFKPEGKEIEWEEEKEYTDEDRIWGDIESILGIDTDMVVLNRARSGLAYEVLRAGIPVIIKDRNLYWRFFSLVGSAAEDWRDLVDDYYRIYQRSRSLTKEDRARLEKIIIFLENELRDYPKFRSLDQKEFQENVSKRREVERWVENIANSSIDIAKIILASNKESLPDTYIEIMRSLGKMKNFDQKTAEKLADFAKLRNLLAHEYLDLRFAKIKKFLEFAEEIYGRLLKFSKNIVDAE